MTARRPSRYPTLCLISHFISLKLYLLDRDGAIFYRKVARRRAYSPEFLDAIDYHAKKSG